MWDRALAKVLHWFVYAPERGERAKWALLFRHDRNALNCMNSEIIMVDWDHSCAGERGCSARQPAASGVRTKAPQGVERGREGEEEPVRAQPGRAGKAGTPRHCVAQGAEGTRRCAARPDWASEGQAIMVSAVDRSPSSPRVSGVVTPGRTGTASPTSGKASRHSSPSATALTPSVRAGRALHRAEVSGRTAIAVALVGAPSASLSSRSRAGPLAVDARAGAVAGDGGVKPERGRGLAEGTAVPLAAARRATVDGAQH